MWWDFCLTIMAICDKCFHKIKRFDEYEGLRIICTAHWQTILPDPLIGEEVSKAVRNNKCLFFNQITKLNKDGSPYIVTDEDTEFEEDNEGDNNFAYYGGL